jgi:hypothetical protein
MNPSDAWRPWWPFISMIVMAASLLGPMRPTAAEETVEQKYVVAIERIWDRPGHAAFTDMIALGDDLYCTFREGSGHIPGLNGLVRVIRARDGMNWESVALLEERHVDLAGGQPRIRTRGRQDSALVARSRLGNLS